MIPDEHRKILKDLAHAYVDELFKDFQNPNNRGPKFTWEGFPKLISGIVYVSAFTCFSDDEFRPHYRDYARDKAYEYAKELLSTKIQN